MVDPLAILWRCTILILELCLVRYCKQVVPKMFTLISSMVNFISFIRDNSMKIHYIIPIALLPMFALGTQVSAQSPLTVSKTIKPDEVARARVFWTDKRISEAKPFPIPIDYGPSEVNQDGKMEEATEDLGVPGKTPPGRAVGDKSQDSGFFSESDNRSFLDDTAGDDESNVREEEVGDILSDGDIEITFKNGLLDSSSEIQEGTKSVYTSYIVNNKTALWRVYPHVWVGRLTFEAPNGTNYCSATAISGNNIVTAAHCVYDSTNNIWFDNWAFTPAYRNGSRPYGTFPANSCWILTAWVNLWGNYSINTWARHDVAVCEMDTNEYGRTLSNAVGWAGRQVNLAYTQLHFLSGYPLKDFRNQYLPAAGAYLRSCTAESFYQAYNTLGMGCNWGGGISGGSWLLGYKPLEVSGWVNSVNSGMYIGQTNAYGARFNSSNIVPLCNSAGC